VITNDSGLDCQILIKYQTSLSNYRMSMLNKAREFPTCKFQIFSVSLLFWYSCYVNATNLLIQKQKPVKITNCSDMIKKFLNEKKLAHPGMIDLFFDIHGSLILEYVNQCNEIIESSDTLINKIIDIADKFELLIDIIYEGLKGLKISCRTIKGYDEYNFRNDCTLCTDSDNVIVLYLYPEYYVNQTSYNNVLNYILSSLNCKDIVFIVNYEKLCEYFGEYTWTETGAFKRFQLFKEHFYNVYFYKYHGCINFAEFTEEVKPHLLKNSTQLFKIVDEWRATQGKQKIYTDRYEKPILTDVNVF